MTAIVGAERMLVSRVGPQQYVCEEGAYGLLPTLLQQGGWQTVLVLHGENGYPKAQPYLPELSELDIDLVDVEFGGECTRDEIARVIGIVTGHRIGVIIGIGGGKVLDTAKAAGYLAGDVPFILLPTLASNCAAWSPLSVLYNPDSTPIGHEVFATQAKAVLVEPRVVFDSPVDLFVAGVADTLAKWYECREGLDRAPDQSLAVGFAKQAAQQCKDVLLASAPAAIEDMRNGAYTGRWARVMEVNIMSGGMVGGFGGVYGRATGAHSVHDGISALPGSHTLLHGIKVAYGILVQLALEGRWDDVEQLLPFYDRLGLPVRIADLGLDPSDAVVASIAAVSAAPDKTIHALDIEVDAATVERAIRELEEFGSHNERNPSWQK